jgi:hypothetical protein
MTPAIYLHIGRNKVGSKTLQDYFARHADWLAAQGVRYALFGHLCGSMPGLPGFTTPGDLADAFRANPGTAILISHEMISALPPDIGRPIAAALRDVAPHVICYIRPYRDWVRSSYGFDTRIGLNRRDFDTYLAALAPRISCLPALELWGEALGWDRLRVRSTDPRDLVGGGLVQDCLAALGLTPPEPVAPARQNAMPDWRVIELLRSIGGDAAGEGWDFAGRAVAEALHELMDEAIAAGAASPAPATYLTRQQSARLAEQYNNDIAWLHSRTGIALHPDDASGAPERAFLPSAAHISPALLRRVAACASEPAYARVHPEAAAFVVADQFLALGARAP